MLYLGIDLGTSYVKVSVWDAETGRNRVTVQYPEQEAPILSRYPGWAEQSPDDWWNYVRNAIHKANATKTYDAADISGIGIAYQMHGLVLLDQQGANIGNSLIWCDSRAVNSGERMLHLLGKEYCYDHLLNAPGNFTAAKLAWLQEHEPHMIDRIHQLMLPGDYIAFRMTGEATTTASALSEGTFWDFKEDQPATRLFKEYQWNPDWIPPIRQVFGEHGYLSSAAAAELQLVAGIPLLYKAGDQMNNAWSLGVEKPGQIAATAGTSGVIFAVTDQTIADPHYRINTFAHIHHSTDQINLGLLMCINGAGILNKWMRQISGNRMGYDEMNQMASKIQPGSEGLHFFPFGNGTERMLGNQLLHAHIQQIDFNRHTPAHLFRAAQEGVAFAFRYGLDLLREMKVETEMIRAGRANLFLSEVFVEAFVQLTQTPLELIDTNGSVGAAMGAARGSGKFTPVKDSKFSEPSYRKIDPDKNVVRWEELYQEWLCELNNKIKN